MKIQRGNFISHLGMALMMLMIYCTTGYSQATSTESFEGTTFVPIGWTKLDSTLWTRNTGGGGAPNPISGNAMARFNSATTPAGTSTTIVTPAIDNSNAGVNDTAKVSFWIWRNLGNGADSVAADSLTILINTVADTVGATRLGAIARSRIINLPDTFGAPSAWRQYTFNFPPGFNTSTNYILFKGTSQGGSYIYLDMISWTSFPAPCTGIPTAGTISATDTLLCKGSGSTTLTMNGASFGTAGLFYTWQSGSSSTGPWSSFGTNDTIALTGTITATTYYQCVVTCSNSGQWTTSPVFQVSVIADSGVSVSPSPAVYCINSNVPVTLTATGATTYAWSPATGLDTTQGSVVHAIGLSVNPFQITYTVVGTKSTGCLVSTTTVLVRSRTSPNINISTGNPLNTICLGDSINLEVNANPGDNVVYSWTPGGTTSLDSIWVSPTSDSTVYLVSASRYGCSDSTSIDSVTIYTVPHVIAGFTYTVSGLDVTFTNTSQHSNAYTWYYGDGDSSYTAGTHTHTYPYDNTWTVTLIADTSGYCTDTYTQAITIVTTGLNKLSGKNNLKIYPNPSSGKTSVEFSLNEQTAELEVINTLGESIVKHMISPSKNQLFKTEIDLTGFASGIYFVKVRSTSDTFVTKLIKE